MRVFSFVFALAFWSFALSTNAMFNKRASYQDKNGVDIPAPKRLRANLQDLFLSNEVGANRAGTLFADAEDAGAQHLDDLARVAKLSNKKTCTATLSTR